MLHKEISDKNKSDVHYMNNIIVRYCVTGSISLSLRSKEAMVNHCKDLSSNLDRNHFISKKAYQIIQRWIQSSI